MAKYKAGDKIVFGRCKDNRHAEGITIGRVYDVREWDGLICFFDDDKDVRMCYSCNDAYTITKIVK